MSVKNVHVANFDEHGDAQINEKPDLNPMGQSFYDANKYDEPKPSSSWRSGDDRPLFGHSPPNIINCSKVNGRIKKPDPTMAANSYLSRKPSGWKSELALERMELEVASLPQNEYIRWYRSKRGFQVNFRGHAKWFSAFSRGVGTAYSMACDWLSYVQNMVRNEPPPNRILAMTKYRHNTYRPMSAPNNQQWPEHSQQPHAQGRPNFYMSPSQNIDYAAGPPQQQMSKNIVQPPPYPQQDWHQPIQHKNYINQNHPKSYDTRPIHWLPKVHRDTDSIRSNKVGSIGHNTNPNPQNNEWFPLHNKAGPRSDPT